MLTSIDYEGPAVEHLHRFLHFSAQAIEDLLPIVQQRLGLREVLSPNNQLRLQQDIQQEAGQRYLQQISSTLMPHLGRAATSVNVNTGSDNIVSQTHRRDSGVVTSGLTSPTLEATQVNLEVTHSHKTPERMTPALDQSPPSLARTSNVDSSTQSDSQMQGDPAIHQNRQTTFGPASGSGPGVVRPSTPRNFEKAPQYFHSINKEQPYEPLDWCPDIGLDWEAEIDAAGGFDQEDTLTKDPDGTSLGCVGDGYDLLELSI